MKKTYKLQDLCCANCAAKIEAGLNRRPEIAKATISFMTQKLILEADDTYTEDQILEIAQKVIRKVEPDCRIIRK